MGFVQSMSKTVTLFLFGFLLLNCLVVEEFSSQAQVVKPLLPEDEVQTLQTISNKLNNKNWTTISRSSCGSAQWNQNISGDHIQSFVQCNCEFDNGTVCHVTTLSLKGFNLTGILPEELGNLTQLRDLDLTHNYLNGSIPASLSKLINLNNPSLLGNRLTGSIPWEIGKIVKLEELNMEDNMLGGPLPPELGNLRNLRRL